MSVLKRMNTPVFAVEGVLHRDHGGYRLKISGLADGDRTFSLGELKAAFPISMVSTRLTSVSGGWSVRADWEGILWRDFVSAWRPVEFARYALLTSAGDYTTCILLPDLTASQAMLVWGVGGEPLEDEYGGPLRMVVPNLWG
jgi:DMSO/TMAO reductase YedYZ molybdopterin-dependent catalytic subunit